MTRDDFVARYGAIYEHSHWVAERAWDGGIDPGGDVAATLRRVVERAGHEAQLALLRAHPDLANRLGRSALTDHSANEQAGAGLDQCSDEEFAEFQSLNTRYVETFGFPFIIAVKGLDREKILAAFRARVEGTPETEFRRALDEVHKIARLRLAPVQPAPPPREAISYDDLHALVKAALIHQGADDLNADAVADTVCAAERDGAESHGAFRVPGYVKALNSGLTNGHARPRIVDGPPAAVIVDADHGVTPTAYTIGLPALAERAGTMGAAVLAVRNTQHFAALWHEVEWLAERGFAALACTANFPYLAPAGAVRPIFGTNPLAFAYPREGAPLVFDMATSAMARGDIQIAARDGRSVPLGVGIDAEGRPTTDPNAILAGGSQLPFGGHKGSAIALMVELLAGGIVGDLFSDLAAEQADGSGVPPGGVFVLALSPDLIGGPGTRARAEAFIDRLAAIPGIRVPGDRRHANRARGGPMLVQSALLATMRSLAGLETA
ncbi:2-oxo-4-hydroxy-4-carboxy-5-ureidoimidazoline decarboxylase [Acuticoccus kandeliae]|uniref:2-oxo-4-hydroxy-4-carboxy-5-ureidoimidazoline decarboxylase n=1 Tax=Acuticoccus kandeliae TaxID=2073160 RepID=UPI00196B47EB|nr:2-oxo-4-hydroxy-4-carboxy-5-ureidoimidazoline decarboxylase [Acuticoccus kandeliae]